MSIKNTPNIKSHSNDQKNNKIEQASFNHCNYNYSISQKKSNNTILATNIQTAEEYKIGCEKESLYNLIGK